MLANSPLLKEAVAFLKAIRTASRIVLFYHADADGCTAAAQFVLAASEGLGLCFSETLPITTDHLNFETTKQHILATRPDAAIFLDLSIQDKPLILNELLRTYDLRLLIYDDHVPDAPLVDPRITFLNPLVWKGNSPSLIPSVFAFQLQSLLGQTDTLWLAAVGVVGERVAHSYIDFLARVQSTYPNLLPFPLTTPDTVYTSPLARMSQLINSGFLSLHPTTSTLHLLLQAAKNRKPEMLLTTDVPAAAELHRAATEVSLEVERSIAGFHPNPTAAGSSDLYLYRVSSPYRICGIVASVLASRLPKAAVVVSQHFNQRVVIEARRSRNCSLDLVNLLRGMCKSLSCLNVGGHPAAAGAAVSDGLQDMFERRLREDLTDSDTTTP